MEMGFRGEQARLGVKDDFALPITQADLADALGLTVVHVNRSLRWLHIQGLVQMANRHVSIPDWEALADFASFRPLYMHPEGPRMLQSKDCPD
jgi:hypothetical protein